MNWYVETLKKFAVFGGRAQRMEYWVFVLVNLLITVALGFVEGLARNTSELQTSVLASLFTLAVLLPSLGVTVRRLHDTGRSGWWILIGIVPLIGSIVLFIFMVTDSQPGENSYGPNPKEVAAAQPLAGADPTSTPGSS